MKIVQILKTHLDENQSIIATIEYNKGKITSDNKDFLENLEREGIVVNSSMEILYPEDGLKFMEGLQIHFSGSIIRASAVMEI